jgi:signal transduction histidine kinase
MHPEDQIMLDDPRCEKILATGQLIKRRVISFSAFIILFICLVAVALVADQRQSALDRVSAHSANLSAAFEEQVRSIMDSVSGAMEVIVRRIEKEGPDFDLSEWAPLMPGVATSMIQVSVIGPDGMLVAPSLAKPPKPVDLSDREHFRVHRENPNLGLFIGKPELGRLFKQATIQITRRLQGADGCFRGVLVFSLNPDYLTSLHHHVDLGQTGNVTVVGLDSVIRARFTSSDQSEGVGVGSSLASGRSFKDSAFANAGSHTSASVVDGVVRIFNWRKISGYPLIVIVGLGKAEALSAADRHALLILGIAATAVLLVVIMALRLVHEISNRVGHEVALFYESEKLRAAHDCLTEQHEALLTKSAQLAEERINLQKTNAELSLAQQRSEAASKAKAAFLANMSHELRTPLNAIIGFAEVMCGKYFGELSDRYAEYAADIHKSGSQLLGVIDQVLDTVKIEAGKLQLSESKQSLAAIVEKAVRSMQVQAENKHIDLSIRLPSPPISIFGDEARLAQTAVNLLSNAVKFTPANGRVTITAELEESAGVFRLRLRSGL